MSKRDANRRARQRRAKANRQSASNQSALPVIGRRPGWGARVFYILGAVIVAGGIGAGVLFAAIDPPSGDGGGDVAADDAFDEAQPGDDLSAAERRAEADQNGDGTPDSSTEGADVQQYSAPEQVIDPAKSYTAILKTEKGDITIRLRPDIAPNHVNSFVFLAQQDFFDNVTFHRVVEGFVAQTGDPTGTGGGGPGYTLNAELSDELFVAGAVGAARANDLNSAGSQFFITLEDSPHLNGNYTVFGEVVDGMDVARSLTVRSSGPPGDTLLDVEIIES